MEFIKEEMLMPDYFGKNTFLAVKAMYVPEIGSFLKYEDKSYVITQCTTYQEMSGMRVEVVHVMTCYEVDDDTNILPDQTGPIILKSNMPGITAE